MAMATTPIDRHTMLMAAREWERQSHSFSMERGLLLELIGLCELIGPELSQALEGRRSAGLAHLCTSAMEQWSKNEETGLIVASPSRMPTRLPSQESCIADWMVFVLAVAIVIRLLKKTGPGRSRGSRRIRQRQVANRASLGERLGLKRLENAIKSFQAQIQSATSWVVRRDRPRSPEQAQIENQLTTATPPPKETISCATPPKENTSCDPPNKKRKLSPKVEEDLEKDFHLSKKLKREKSLLAEEMDESKALENMRCEKLRREMSLSVEEIDKSKTLDDNPSKMLKSEKLLLAEETHQLKACDDNSFKKLTREGDLSAAGTEQSKALDDNLPKKLTRENSLSAEDIEKFKILDERITSDLLAELTKVSKGPI